MYEHKNATTVEMIGDSVYTVIYAFNKIHQILAPI